MRHCAYFLWDFYALFYPRIRFLLKTQTLFRGLSVMSQFKLFRSNRSLCFFKRISFGWCVFYFRKGGRMRKGCLITALAIVLIIVLAYIIGHLDSNRILGKKCCECGEYSTDTYEIWGRDYCEDCYKNGSWLK